MMAMAAAGEEGEITEDGQLHSLLLESSNTSRESTEPTYNNTDSHNLVDSREATTTTTTTEKDIEDGDKPIEKEADKDNNNKESEHVAMENGDDNEPIVVDAVDDTTSDKLSDDDLLTIGESFFLREPFTSEEFKDVQGVAKAQVTKSMELLDREGYKVFREWRSKESNKRVASGQAERKRVQQAIQEAKIRGAPREYQQRLFEIACKRNTVIHLGTGRGKTMIALMCIRHFSGGFGFGKQTLFLVPSVALAIQQSTVLRANLPFSVQMACYSTGPSEKARKDLQDCNIIVATHGTIYDLLSHYGDMFTMAKFNLLVIDEAHYATGAHCYATLMKRFYHPLPEVKRPHVVGLTASPLIKVKATHTEENLVAMLDSLESTLDAQVVSHVTNVTNSVTVSDTDSPDFPTDLVQQSAVEKDVLYSTCTPYSPLITHFGRFKLHESRQRECQQLFPLYEDLGPLVCAIYCQTLAREVSRNSYEKESQEEFQNLIRYLTEVARVCDRLSRDCPHGGRSDKLLALEELLEDQVEEQSGSERTCIVFVERRITALALDDFFRFRLKALADDNNWNRAVESRKLPRKSQTSTAVPDRECHTVAGAVSTVKCASPTPSESSLSSSAGAVTEVEMSPPVELPPPAVLKVAPSNSMDQFADADSDDGGDGVNLEETTAVSLGSDDLAMASGAEGSSSAGGIWMASNLSQFMDADDDDDDQSQALLQGYLTCIRGDTDESGGHLGDPFVGSNVNEEADVEALAPRVCVARKLPSLDQFCDAGDYSDEAEVPQLTEEDRRTDHEDDADDVGRNGGGQRKDTIRCRSLVRQSTHIFKSLNMSRRLSQDDHEESRKTWLHQEGNISDVLAALRRGAINTLIATSVVEEGVDIQACSCVVAFDSLRSTKGYIQMKGRARQKHAKFFVFKSDKEGPALSLDSAQEIERRVEHFIARRSSLSVAASPPNSRASSPVGEVDCAEIRAVEEGIYQATHGTVDMHSAKSLVNRYVSSLPLDPLVRSSKASILAHLPTYSAGQLGLPSHLPTKLRTIQLPKRYSELPQKQKDQVLSMMACVRLHRHGLLSERMLPLSRTDLQEKMLAMVNVEPRNIPVPRLTSYGVNETRKTFFVYILHQENTRIDKLHKILKGKGHSLAILSTAILPPVPEMRVSHSGFGTVACSLGELFSVECSEHEFRVIARFTKLMFDSRWRRRTKNVFFRPKKLEELSGWIPQTWVGVTKGNQELDFSQMLKLLVESKRSEAERIKAVSSTSDVEGLSTPRLWAPLYDRNFTYITYGPSGTSCNAAFPTDREREGVDTYRDYFKKCRDYDVDGDCLLFDAQRLWVLPFSKATAPLEEDDDDFEPKTIASGAHSKLHVVCEDLKSLMLPKDACIELPMADPNFLLLATHLPQFLYHMQPYLTASAFLVHCHNQHMPRLEGVLKILPPEKVAEALTAKSCAEEGSYEKLEWFGDAVLKLLQTDSLLHSKDFTQWIDLLHEGDLSILRSVMGSNDRLAVACKNLKIDQFLLTMPLGRGQWAPDTLELYSPTMVGSDTGEGVALKESIPHKTHADVIESILGIVYMTSGYEEACAVADELQVALEKNNKPQTPPDSRISPKPHLLAAAAALTGHTDFRRHDLVQEAFTHPTAIHPEVPSYQRLEWIGDAVLCLCVRAWIFNTFPAMQVGQMVAMEASLVCNETLAYLSIKHGLLQNLDHCDQTLPTRIEHYEWCTRERGLWSTDPPKVAADVVESVLGAVYMDSGFAHGANAVSHVLSPMFQVLEKLYTKDSNLVMMHPKKALQEMGGSLLSIKVMREEDFASQHPETNVWLGRRWGTASVDGNGKFIGRVESLGLNVVSVADSSSEVAGNRACALAVAMLKKDPDLLSRVQLARTMVESFTSKEEKKRSKALDEVDHPKSMEVDEAERSHKAAADGGATIAEAKAKDEDGDDAGVGLTTTEHMLVPALLPEADIGDANDDDVRAVVESMVRNILG